MSLSYQPVIFGPTWAFPFTNSARTIRLAAPDGRGNVKRQRYEIRVTQACRVNQGGPNVVASVAPVVATKGGSGTVGARYLKTAERWVVDVFDAATSYLSIVRDTTNGNIEISRLDSTDTSDPPVWVGGD